ncbi:MAG: NAD(P)H-binding protein [Actinomycetota bacterium]|nr:NAD(P)H-binding protein [Actinomycetota bacterium]
MISADTDTRIDVVTGAFSNSGRRIAARLHARGRAVRTLTGHPERDPHETPITTFPLSFDDPVALIDAMAGATTLYNTYWVRFAHGHADHSSAVRNSRALFEAAQQAGVQRVVHVSITNPSPDSPLTYFRGKAKVEQLLAATDISQAIVRPAILFGGEDVLINNIAWLRRHLPVFAIGARGQYRVRGVHVDDLADLCVELGLGRSDVTIDAVGPDRPTFDELVRAIRAAVGSRTLLILVPGAAVPALGRVLGVTLRDVVLEAEEYQAMAAGLADRTTPTTGTTSILDWIDRNGADLGHRYANELQRHFATPQHGSTPR